MSSLNPLNYNQCPWDNYAQATIQFCESQQCSWVVKPAETWSNIGFVIAGILILRACQREKTNHLRVMGWVGIILGICSGLFHATGTFWGEYLDVGSMILFTTVGFAYNLRRWFGFDHRRMLAVYLGTVGLCLTLMLIIRPIGIPLFGILFATAALVELRLYFKFPARRPDYTYFKAMTATFLIVWSVWWLDILKIVCNPHNHWFNGHAFWHLGCALCLYFVYRFYSQFKEFSIAE